MSIGQPLDPAGTGRPASFEHSEADSTLRSDAGTAASWPDHVQERRSWVRQARGGTKDDRMLSTVTVSMPPLIADLDVPVSPRIVAGMESALREVVALDTRYGTELTALGGLLLRTESVASSKIEHIEASVDDYARALHGVKSNPAAVSMAAATQALGSLIGSVTGGGNITLESILTAHEALMRDDSHEAAYAGRVRDMQNWIGGSDYSPRNALYVPPPPDHVDDYLEDLVRFANRDDLPVLTQAAVAHAQFESVHPFTDGNGRIGRALVNTILRRRGVTSRVVIPLASALVAHRDRYFDLLGDYRNGDPVTIQRAFSEATLIAATESAVTARKLADIPEQWSQMLGPVRSGSAASTLLALLPDHPVVTAEEAALKLGSPASSVFSAINRLHEAGVLRPLTNRQRGQVWGAGLVLDELTDLGDRIGLAAR